MMHAASDKPARARSAGLPRGDCGPGPAEIGPAEGGLAEGGRASSRSIFATCSVKRASCSSARAICSWACASRSSARAIRASWGSLGFGVGVEFTGASQCHPKVVVDRLRRVDQPPPLRAVLSKEWPYRGKIWDHMAIASGAVRRGPSRPGLNDYYEFNCRHRPRGAGISASSR
jgi:hypothetical protein